MLRNYLAAALGNLSRTRLHAAITILGLAVGFAAAILVGLYVRDEFSFESFISGYQQVYRLETDILAPGTKPQRTDGAASIVAADLALDFPQVQGVVRLARSSQWVGRSEAKSWERVAWTDPDFFRVLPVPVLAGDPVAALHDPDGVVLTRQAARKFFGMDAPIGRTLQVQHVVGDDAFSTALHPMVVRAVLKDVPSSTHLEQFKFYASGRAPWSGLVSGQNDPTRYPIYWTYVRLPPGFPADRLRAGLPAFAARHYAGPIGWRFRLEPLKDLHFIGAERAVDMGIAVVGVLIILVAAINFVTLMTACATRRAVEVGVRKAVGARRIDLVIQFMGEAMIQVLLAMIVSLAIVELALPAINAFLRRTIAFDFLHDLALASTIAGTVLLTGLIAGLYPAVVLSGFRPSTALKGKGGRAGRSAHVRQGLVVVQFAVLVCLMILGATIWRQTSFALTNMLRLNEDQIVGFGENDRPFKQEIVKLPGVSGVTSASNEAVGEFPIKTFVKDPAHGAISIDIAPADVGFFEMIGLKPLAGRFFSGDRGEDMVLDRPNPGPENQPSVVLNESGARQLGFATPQEAVGRTISWGRLVDAGGHQIFRSSEIIGVAPDFTIHSGREPIDPTIYYVDPAAGIMFAKLQGQRIPETLSAIDALWRRMGHARPIKRQFLVEAMRDDYRDVEVQGAIIGGSAGLAIVIACLGLFSMAAFTAERRTKEIGVRKANGAGTPDVLRLLLWQFAKPVLWANIVAWPLAFWAAERWLQGFAYRVSLPPWLFLAASAAAVLIALATVAGQAWVTAQAKPATALRYE
jgi:putative ABC transport system permease protein